MHAGGELLGPGQPSPAYLVRYSTSAATQRSGRDSTQPSRPRRRRLQGWHRPGDRVLVVAEGTARAPGRGHAHDRCGQRLTEATLLWPPPRSSLFGHAANDVCQRGDGCAEAQRA